MHTIAKELKSIEELADGGLAPEVVLKRLQSVFQDISEARHVLGELESRARHVALSATRAQRAQNGGEQGEEWRPEVFYKALSSGNRLALERIASSSGKSSQGYPLLAQAIVLQADGQFQEAAAHARIVAERLGVSSEGGMLAQLMALRAELGAQTKGLSRPLAPDVAAQDNEALNVANQWVADMVALARDMERGTDLEMLSRLLVAEGLYVIGRFDAASITLRPVVEDESLGPAASYLDGKIQYAKNAGKAMARASWIRASKAEETPYGRWAKEAVEALGEMKEPKLYALLDF